MTSNALNDDLAVLKRPSKHSVFWQTARSRAIIPHDLSLTSYRSAGEVLCMRRLIVLTVLTAIGALSIAVAPAQQDPTAIRLTTPTGAFPNQLAAIAIHPFLRLAYVVSTGASPNGPLRFMRPDGTDAWVVVQNSNVVVRLTVNNPGIPTIGAPLAAGPGSVVRVDLENVGSNEIPGKAPRGIVIDPEGDRAYVSNFVSRSVTVIDISNPTAPEIEATARSSDLPAPGTTEATALLGAELFYTGRGPQGRMSSESWGGCIASSCRAIRSSWRN